ncbi:MAG: HAMP domain-containing histidine kinase [Planctomycetes bacterium]|nr:HAMP domain-containing histidine kinase [Planctomycetota bacterium]
MADSRPRTPIRIPPRREPDGAATAAPPPHDALTAALLPDAPTLTPHDERLQTELDRLAERFEQLHAQLRQAQKLASLGATAAIIAHEFNNLFTPIVAYARQALDANDVPLMRKALDKTLSQVAIMRTLSDRVIGLAKQSDNAVRSVNLAKTVESAIDCLCRDLGKDNIAVQVQIDPALAVRANEGALLQVLFNLVINARQAMLGRRGRLTVDAAARDGEVEINVRDTGCGISPENLDRVFEPFFTTKGGAERPDRRGLGLGLAICRDMIEELHGTITVASQLNVGTTFTIRLPQGD